jgi:hypothetical protein
MHELIVERHMDQWDGSIELGVPKETFVTWRTRFRLGADQRRADFAERTRNKTLEEYKDKLEHVDLGRPFDFRNEKSLRGFKEIIERRLELEKQRRLLDEIDTAVDIFHAMRIATLESIIEYLNQYDQYELYKTFDYDLEFLKSNMPNG